VIVEAVELTRQILDHSTIGVNTKLSGVPRFTGHAEPPQVADVVSALDDDDVGRDQLPVKSPALIVGAGPPFTIQGTSMTGAYADGEDGGVVVQYATNDPDLAEATRDALYTMRAVLRSIRESMENANESIRTANDVVLVAGMEFRAGRRLISRQEGAIVAQADVIYHVRDTAPNP